jgi:IS5 family transposase
MPQQLTVARAEYEAKKKTTRRDRFLAEMQRVVSWAARLEVLVPHDDPDAGRGAGRPPIGLERMRRMYCVQQWFGLSDEGLEETIDDAKRSARFWGSIWVASRCRTPRRG